MTETSQIARQVGQRIVDLVTFFEDFESDEAIDSALLALTGTDTCAVMLNKGGHIFRLEVTFVGMVP